MGMFEEIRMTAAEAVEEFPDDISFGPYIGQVFVQVIDLKLVPAGSALPCGHARQTDVVRIEWLGVEGPNTSTIRHDARVVARSRTS